MHIGLIASPFISVPPPAYGGTELFIGNLAEALIRLGAGVTVYTNGESTVKAEKRWIYPKHEWPLSSELAGLTRELEHSSWAMADAERRCDIVHLNSALSVPFSRLTARPTVCTLHHRFEPPLSDLYERHARTKYVAISAYQAARHPVIAPLVVHHGLEMKHYLFSEKKQPYLSFLGRICPVKGPHNAIEIAKRVGMPLKIAGEVQPIFRDYFETKIKPHIDGRNVEFLGEAGPRAKNELLSGASALLFPIEWDEPFGLVMIEAMACGTPVIAFPGGAVEEVIDNGISGRVCANIDEAVAAIQQETFYPRVVRKLAEQRFSADVMATQYFKIYSDLLEEPGFAADFDAEEAAA